MPSGMTPEEDRLYKAADSVYTQYAVGEICFEELTDYNLFQCGVAINTQHSETWAVNETFCKAVLSAVTWRWLQLVKRVVGFNDLPVIKADVGLEQLEEHTKELFDILAKFQPKATRQWCIACVKEARDQIAEARRREAVEARRRARRQSDDKAD